MRTAAALGVALLAACGPSTSVTVAPPVHLHFAAGAAPCGGTAAYLASIATQQAAFLGVPLPSQIDVFYQPSPKGFPCPVETNACYSPTANQIWSQVAVNEHELVHAILQPTFGAVIPFLSEGVAVALGGEDIGPADYSISPSALVTAWTGSRSEYATAGDFVSWLLSTNGPAAFTSVYGAAKDGSSLAAVDDLFTATYGASFSTMYSQRAAAGSSFPGGRLLFPECAAAVVPWATPQWQASLTVDCHADGIGPTSDGLVFRRVAFDIPATQVLSFSFDDMRTDGIRSAHVGDCTSLSSFFDYSLPNPALASMFAKNPIVVAPENAGHHFLSITVDRPTTTTVGVVASSQSFGGSDCAMLAPVDVDPSTGGIYISPAVDGSALFAVFRSAQTRNLLGYNDAANATLCVGACDMSSCTTLSLGTPSSVVAGQVYTLVARSSSSSPGALSGLVFE